MGALASGRTKPKEPEGAYNSAAHTLRVTPAMEAGIADHVWSIEEIAALLEKR